MNGRQRRPTYPLRYYSHVPHGDPIPPGAEVLDYPPDHHSRHSIMVRRHDIEAKETPPDAP